MAEVAEKAHAVLGPSGWDTWGTCPGSVVLSEGMPNKSSPYARLGTAAHALLEDCLSGGLDAEDLLGREYVVEGEVHMVDPDMADAVDAAINIVKDVIQPERGDILLIEQSVPLTQLTGEQDAEGTSDVIGITNGGRTLVVMDYKHGQGVKVYASTLECEPNGQMAMYALGSLHKYGMLYDEIETVELHILQPRQEHHDTVTLPVEQLLAFGHRVVEAAGRVELNRADRDNLDLVPSEKGCKFCKAKHRCPALKALTVNALEKTSDAADFDDLTLPKKASSAVVSDFQTPEQLAEIMRAAPLIEDFIKAVRAEVERRLFVGLPVPGYKVVEGKKGNRQWNDDKVALIELTKSGRLKVAEATTAKVISATAAEKLLKDRPKIWSKIAPLIVQRDGSPSVAKDDDPRPTYRLASEEGEFDDMTALPSASIVEDLMG